MTPGSAAEAFLSDSDTQAQSAVQPAARPMAQAAPDCPFIMPKIRAFFKEKNVRELGGAERGQRSKNKKRPPTYADSRLIKDFLRKRAENFLAKPFKQVCIHACGGVLQPVYLPQVYHRAVAEHHARKLLVIRAVKLAVERRVL